MPDSASARQYLESMLPFGHWQAASRTLGRHHAYIQQHIRRGSPRWLAETDRDILVRLYDLDPEMLRPPAKSETLGAKKIPGHGYDQADVDFQTLHQIIDDPSVLQLIWACLRIVGDDEKRTALKVLTALGHVSRDRLSTDRADDPILRLPPVPIRA